MKPIRLTAALFAASVAVTGAAAQEHQAQANNAVSGQYAARQQGIADQNAESLAQYDADMAAYRAAVHRDHRQSAHDARRYAHQQRAYADAMRDWRRQVWACKHGSRRACNAPSPNPANYW